MPKYGHHSALGNLECIADNLILIQDHLSGANVRCPECLVKHGETVRAYASEAFALDDSEKVMPLLAECAEYGDGLVLLISECATEGGKCRITNMQQLIDAINKARQLRRKVNTAVYGLAGDLVYDSEAGSGAEHSHGMEVEHSHGSGRAREGMHNHHNH